jgi:hypothetical protein
VTQYGVVLIGDEGGIGGVVYPKFGGKKYLDAMGAEEAEWIDGKAKFGSNSL